MVWWIDLSMIKYVGHVSINWYVIVPSLEINKLVSCSPENISCSLSQYGSIILFY